MAVLCFGGASTATNLLPLSEGGNSWVAVVVSRERLYATPSATSEDVSEASTGFSSWVFAVFKAAPPVIARRW